MEKLDWRSSSSQAKVLGTVVSITGAFVATLYKGHPIMFVHESSSKLPVHLALSPQSKWALGGFFFAIEALLFSSWYIMQVLILKEYPVIIVINLFANLFETAIAASISLVLVTDAQAWKLTLEKGLLSIVYSSVATGVFRTYVIQWCLKRTGPLYVSVFKPVGIIFVVALGVTFLGDPLRSGSLIGAVVIVCGFYAVMWGKAREEKCEDVDGEVGRVSTRSHDNPNHKTPFLVAP